MKRFKKTSRIVSTLCFVLFLSSCDMYTYVTPPTQVRYDNPTWAPPYYPGVRYYYLPDIETYYDLTSQQFVFLDNGQWTYSQNLPSMYAGYDLDNCFAVAIDYNTYQPWLHYQYYVSHYPRYYYRDYYDHSNIPYVRGFNENSKSAIYWSENERNRARRWDDENLKKNHQFKYSESDRREQNNTNLNNRTPRPPDMNPEPRRRPDAVVNKPQKPNRGDNNVANQQPNRGDNTPQQPNRGDNKPTPPDRSGNGNTRGDNKATPPDRSGNGNTNRPQGNEKNSNVTPPRTSGFETGSRQQNAVTPGRPNQNTNYYGRTIGRPVKVEKQMREPAPAKAPASTETRNSSDSKDRNEGNRR